MKDPFCTISNLSYTYSVSALIMNYWGYAKAGSLFSSSMYCQKVSRNLKSCWTESKSVQRNAWQGKSSTFCYIHLPINHYNVQETSNVWQMCSPCHWGLILGPLLWTNKTYIEAIYYVGEYWDQWVPRFPAGVYISSLWSLYTCSVFKHGAICQLYQFPL